MKVTDQLVCLWLTPFFGAVLVFAFLLFPGFVPPMSPTMPAADVAAFFRDNAAAIRWSMVLFNLTDVMLLSLFAVVCVQMKRMATPSPALAYALLCTVASVVMLFALSDLLWLIAAYRPERDPELIVLLNDMAWITFATPVGLFCAQCIFLGISILLDGRPQPVFPRWAAHFNFAVAALTLPSALSAMQLSGPLAWDGAISFTLRWIVFAIYIVVMFVLARRAIHRQGAEIGATA